MPSIAHRPAGRPHRLATLATAAGASALFCLCAWLSLTFTRGAEQVAFLWPANAVLLTLVLRSRRDEPFAFIVAGFVGNLAAYLLAGDSLDFGLSLAMINTFEVVVCYLAIKRFASPRPDLGQPRDLLTFIVAAGVLAPGLSGAVAALALPILVGAEPLAVWGTWWAADALGLLVITPALCNLMSFGNSMSLQPGYRWRAAGLALLLAATLAVVFVQDTYPLLFLIPPVLLLIAFQLDMAACGLALLLTATAAMAAGFLGSGPVALSDAPLPAKMWMQQGFLAVLVLSILPTATAIIHRRRLIQEVADQRRRFQLLADNSTDVIGCFDLKGRFLYLSPSIERCLGYRAEEMVGRKVVEFMHPDDVAPTTQRVIDLIAAGPQGPSVHYEYRARHKDGRWIWLETHPRLLVDAGGQPVEIQDCVRDITGRKAAEAELARALADAEAQRLRLQLISDSASDLISRMDMDGRCVFVSPSAKAIMGYEPAEVIGRRYVELMHPEDAPAIREVFQAMARDGLDRPAQALEYRARHKDGQWVWLEANPTLIRDEAGAPVEYIDVIRDIGERKAVETELRAARAAAEAAATAKADFLSNMSHELRTPLTSIIGFSGLLADSRDLGEVERRFVSRIGTASQALLCVINDILDFSKLEDDGLQLEPRPFDAHTLLSESVALLGPQAEAKELALSFAMDLPGDDPAASAWVIGDEGRLRQVVLNLLSNAVKFTTRGEVKLSAALVDAGEGARRLEVAVSDTGMGIEPDQIDRLFERFTQADGSISRRFGGTGLGLSISRRLVELMGGEITVTSRPGEGSTFSFAIELAAGAGEACAEDVGPGASLAGVRILVADDSEANRELMTAYLRALDAEVDTACDGGEAVAAVQARDYRLVLMDVNMPVMSGLDAARAIRELGGAFTDLPIVALTADVSPRDVARCAAAGMNGHVAKPIVPADLHAALQQSLFERAA